MFTRILKEVSSFIICHLMSAKIELVDAKYELEICLQFSVATN